MGRTAQRPAIKTRSKSLSLAGMDSSQAIAISPGEALGRCILTRPTSSGASRALPLGQSRSHRVSVAKAEGGQSSAELRILEQVISTPGRGIKKSRPGTPSAPARAMAFLQGRRMGELLRKWLPPFSRSSWPRTAAIRHTHARSAGSERGSLTQLGQGDRERP